MRTIRHVLAVIVGLISAAIAFVLVDYVDFMMVSIRMERSDIWMMVYIFFCVVVPLLAAYFTAKFIGRWQIGILTRLRCLPHWFLVVVVIAYMFTWVFGVPAVQTATNADAVEKYKREKKYNSGLVWDTLPWIRTSAAFPLLPGLIVSYHEYQVAGLHGWGGWELHVWYLTGVKSIGRLPVWKS